MTTPDLEFTKAAQAQDAHGADHAVRTAGRVLVGVLFLWAGIDKLLGWPDALREVVAGGLPFPGLMLALTVLLQVGGGAAIILGRWLRASCWALAGFTALATVLYHDFWHASGAARHAQLIPFMEHVCIVGALLVLSTLGGPRQAR